MYSGFYSGNTLCVPEFFSFLFVDVLGVVVAGAECSLSYLCLFYSARAGSHYGILHRHLWAADERSVVFFHLGDERGGVSGIYKKCDYAVAGNDIFPNRVYSAPFIAFELSFV